MGDLSHLTEDEIIDRIDGLPGGDPDGEHGQADELLLAAVSPAVADAYRRLVDRCAWWATA